MPLFKPYFNEQKTVDKYIKLYDKLEIDFDASEKEGLVLFWLKILESIAKENLFDENEHLIQHAEATNDNKYGIPYLLPMTMLGCILIVLAPVLGYAAGYVTRNYTNLTLCPDSPVVQGIEKSMWLVPLLGAICVAWCWVFPNNRVSTKNSQKALKTAYEDFRTNHYWEIGFGLCPMALYNPRIVKKFIEYVIDNLTFDIHDVTNTSAIVGNSKILAALVNLGASAGVCYGLFVKTMPQQIEYVDEYPDHSNAAVDNNLVLRSMQAIHKIVPIPPCVIDLKKNRDNIVRILEIQCNSYVKNIYSPSWCLTPKCVGTILMFSGHLRKYELAAQAASMDAVALDVVNTLDVVNKLGKPQNTNTI